MWTHILILAQAAPAAPGVESSLLPAALQAGAVGALLLAAVFYLVKRDNAREARELVRIHEDVKSREQNTAALTEVRKTLEDANRLRKRTTVVLERAIKALEG
jgi:uncharacterized protein YlxW (UPF0749 family)